MTRITWSFLVKNTGTVTMTTVAVTDPKAGAIVLPGHDAGPGCVDDVHGAAAYTITQADVDAAVVNNTATASGKNPAAATVTSNASSTSTPVAQTSTLQLTKSAVGHRRQRATAKTDLGDRITWSFLVKNTGHDDRHDGGGDRPDGRRDLLPGDDAGPGRVDDVHRGAHTITQADVDAGVVEQHGDGGGARTRPARP